MEARPEAGIGNLIGMAFQANPTVGHVGRRRAGDRLPARLFGVSRRGRECARYCNRAHPAETAGPPCRRACRRMETDLTAARLASDWMLAAARANAPSAGSVNQVMIGRQLVARHAIAAVDLAMELAQGAGFYRAAGLERRFRDIQAARYHPLQSGPQAQYTGALALGLSVKQIF